MSDSCERVIRYYSSDPAKEWARLESLDTGPIEFELTTRRLREHLLPESRVLDIGGGPGRYTIWLAKEGHRVVLGDFVPALIEEATKRIAAAGVTANVDEAVVADVCDLSRWGDASFDAALCLGPFYHLPEQDSRHRAASELVRVLKPGAFLFAAFMPRLGFLKRSIATRAEWAHLRDPEFVRRLAEDGVFLNDNPGRFDAGYGAKPGEIAPFFAAHGIENVALLAAEGFAPPVSDELSAMARDDPQSYEAALEMLAAHAADPSILGAANHLLYIGRKR
jgi:ubiquinone/menaquinone biosynthesis C-methylase UbiE